MTLIYQKGDNFIYLATPMLYYFLVFLGALFVDLLPFFGPPAWTVMVLIQMEFHLNIWAVLFSGVIGSTLGRYILSAYIPYLSSKIIKDKTIDDIEFIGRKLGGKGWGIQLFVLLYTLMPLPSTPLFTAAGMAKIKPLHIFPAFFAGKFISDMIMVFSGAYVAKNTVDITRGFLSFESLLWTILGLAIIFIFLFIDWRRLLVYKKFRLNFNIWR